MRLSVALPVALATGVLAVPAAAAEPGIRHLEGTDLCAIWAVPFVGILLSIAILPLAAPAFLAPPLRQGRGVLGALRCWCPSLLTSGST